MAQALLAIVEFFALCTSVNGLYFIAWDLDNGIFATLHNCIWFIFAMLSNIFGIASIFIEFWEGRGPTGALGLKTLQALQYHYFFSWMDILVGYAGIVTQTWIIYNPVRLSHLHLALVGIPIVAWLKRKSTLIVVTTQAVTVLAILSHIFITISVRNWWALVGTILVALQIIAMSLPVRFTFFINQFSTREAAVLLGGLASMAFPKGIEDAARYQELKRLYIKQ